MLSMLCIITAVHAKFGNLPTTIYHATRKAGEAAHGIVTEASACMWSNAQTTELQLGIVYRGVLHACGDMIQYWEACTKSSSRAQLA